jgi:exodeoxyribonuclease VII large subunit
MQFLQSLRFQLIMPLAWLSSQEGHIKKKVIFNMDISSLRERGNGAITVSELNDYIKNVFDSSRFLSSVTIKGEISNFTYHRSGHLYFSLKDSDAQIKAVMFRSSASKLKFMPESGMKVIAHGAVSVYQRDGVYQLYVSSMQPDGIGALYLAYEQLKEKLMLEGLFSDEYKKLLPKMPERLGVITSPTGAAVRDIINVTGRRFPHAKLYIYPSLVQGEGAEENLVRGVDYFDKSGLVDVIIIGRGGGSIEDLWAFNSEKLARRIFAAKTPVISAVGHETDFTICDFVADMRAPTPSVAAELAVPDVRELYMRLDSCAGRLSSALERKVEIADQRLANIYDRVVSDGLDTLFSNLGERLVRSRKSAIDLIKHRMEKESLGLLAVAEKLSAFNPLSILQRGYSITTTGDGEIASVNNIKSGDEIIIKINKGKIKAEILDICEDDI